MEPLVLTVEELSEALKIGKEAAYKLIHTDGFPRIPNMNGYRVPVRELREWLASKVRTTDAELEV